MKRALTLLLAPVLCTGLLTGCRDPLAAAKAKVHAQFRAAGKMSTPEPPRTLPHRETETTTLELPKYTITLPVFKSRRDKPVDKPKRIYLTYDRIIAVLNPVKGGHEFDTLPKAWGDSDFEKFQTVLALTPAQIDRATTQAELADLVAKIAARDVINPMGAETRVEFIQTPDIEGFLCGAIRAKGSLTYYFRPRDRKDESHILYFQDLPDPADETPVLDFLSALRIGPPSAEKESRCPSPHRFPGAASVATRSILRVRMS